MNPNELTLLEVFNGMTELNLPLDLAYGEDPDETAHMDIGKYRVEYNEHEGTWIIRDKPADYDSPYRAVSKAVSLAIHCRFKEVV